MSIIQPLSGDNSVFGICLIGGGFFSHLNKWRSSCRAERFDELNLVLVIMLLLELNDSRHPASLVILSDHVLAIIGAEADRLCLQIVGRTDEAHGLAFRAHQNGMRSGLGALPFYAAQERTITDPGCTKDDVFAIGQIVGRKNAVQIFFVAIIDQFLSFLV